MTILCSAQLACPILIISPYALHFPRPDRIDTSKAGLALGAAVTESHPRGWQESCIPAAGPGPNRGLQVDCILKFCLDLVAYGIWAKSWIV